MFDVTHDSPPGWEADWDWSKQVGDQFEQTYFIELLRQVAEERRAFQVFPAVENVFSAFRLTPFHRVRAVILGQDPYHGAGQAHGLSFSVPRGTKIPPSLRNIFKELHSDLGIQIPDHGDLTHWAGQGVLLLNTSLTVRAGAANSHRKMGWTQFTDHVISKLNERARPVVFVLWGKPAATKRRFIDSDRHVIFETAHPSPLSAHRGFLGSQIFSKINRSLAKLGEKPIDWRLDCVDEVPTFG